MPLFNETELRDKALEDVHEAAYDANAPDSDFGYVPKDAPPSGRKFKIGDKEHVQKAVAAYANWEFRGNKPDIPASAKPGLKSKISSAIHKFMSGDEAKYYSSWLSSGKKPDSKPVKEMISFDAPFFRFSDEGNYPNVPLADGVDLAALTAGDNDPLFITRPLAVLNAVSQHGIIYDADLIQTLHDQVLSKRPAARQGHVSEEERDYLFPDDKALWIGALYENGTLYGKSYVLPNTHFKTMVKARKAAGTELKTSMWGMGSYIDAGNGTIRCADLDLETIDFVPAERASLQALPGQFDLTSEMGGSMAGEHADAGADLDMLKKGINSIQPEDVKEVYEAVKGPNLARLGEMYFNEMAPDKVCESLSAGHRGFIAKKHVGESSNQEVYEMLNEGQRRHVMETFAKETGRTVVSADQGLESRGVAEMAGRVKTLEGQVAEMANLKEKVALYERADFNRALDAKVDSHFADWNIRTDDGKTKVAAAKQNLRVLVVAEMAGSTKQDDIAPAAERAWATFKPMAEVTLASLSGPNAFTGVSEMGSASASNLGQFGFDPKTGKYSEDMVNRARSMANITNTTKKGA